MLGANADAGDLLSADDGVQYAEVPGEFVRRWLVSDVHRGRPIPPCPTGKRDVPVNSRKGRDTDIRMKLSEV